ncbi:kinase-like protein [Artomyces pyxidatus]|uniref:Kinase-like protein n=1 Tax=Artomyces pyxidatus TaxID=48021 RepID=A0ACB8SSN6_9AGAM|nr:kinase-like protein [Artomyces pyxidatus]
MHSRRVKKAVDVLDTVVALTLQVLKASPEPISSTVGSILSQIYDSVSATKQNRNQLQFLVLRTCTVLQTLGTAQNYADADLQKHVTDLVRVLEAIRDFAIAQRKKPFLALVFTPDDLRLEIDAHERNLLAAASAFQTAALLHANRKLDDIGDQGRAHHQDLVDRLDTMKTAAANPEVLDELLGTLHADVHKTMTAMQAVLDRERSGRGMLSEEARAFLEAGLRRLKEETGKSVDTHWWTVTGYEVEKGFKIGSSLAAGRWHGVAVAVQPITGSEALLSAVKLWDRIHHPNILSFLGASTTDDPPFVIWPYMPHGTVTHFLEDHRDTDLLTIAFETLRALEYLHARKPPVVHGNLRPSLILVNEARHAVLAGVGLSSMDTEFNAAHALSDNLRNLRWRAPEAMMNQQSSLTTAADVYSWALIVAALFGSKVPEDASKLALGTRPSRPNLARVPALAPQGIQDAFWQLLQRCWSPNPAERPSAAEAAAAIIRAVPWMDPTKLLFDFPRTDGQLVDQMRLSSTSLNEYIMVNQSSSQEPYVLTKPVEGGDEHPVRRVSFLLRCHDQGFHDDETDYRGRYAWVEAALFRRDEAAPYEVDLEKEVPDYHRGHMIGATRTEIIRCKFADSAQQIYAITWDENHPVVRLMKKGDRLGVIPRALFPGWQTHLYGVEVHVICEH